jgi:hypothetical protein
VRRVIVADGGGMDGRLAALFWLMSLPSGEADGNRFEMHRPDEGDRLALSSGVIMHQEEARGWETRLTYIYGDRLFERLHPMIDLSVTSRGGAWIGVGFYQQIDFSIDDLDLFAGFSFAPGIYMQGDEVELGHPVEFRSGVELGWKAPNDWQFSLLYDHRSNASLGEDNPGMETIQFRVSKPIRW